MKAMIVATALVAAPAGAQVLWRNVEAGMTTAQVRALYPAPARRPHLDSGRTTLRGVERIGDGCSADVIILHPNGVVTAVEVAPPVMVSHTLAMIPRRCGEAAQALLIERFGQPASVDETRTDAGGSSEVVTERTWNRNGLAVRLRRFGTEPNGRWKITYEPPAQSGAQRQPVHSPAHPQQATSPQSRISAEGASRQQASLLGRAPPPDAQADWVEVHRTAAGRTFLDRSLVRRVGDVVHARFRQDLQQPGPTGSVRAIFIVGVGCSNPRADLLHLVEQDAAGRFLEAVYWPQGDGRQNALGSARPAIATMLCGAGAQQPPAQPAGPPSRTAADDSDDEEPNWEYTRWDMSPAEVIAASGGRARPSQMGAGAWVEGEHVYFGRTFDIYFRFTSQIRGLYRVVLRSRSRADCDAITPHLAILETRGERLFFEKRSRRRGRISITASDCMIIFARRLY